MLTITSETGLEFPLWYRDQIAGATSLDELRARLRELLPLSGEELHETAEWTEDSFAEFRQLLPALLDGSLPLAETDGRFDWFICSTVMLLVTTAALVSEMSWGRAYYTLISAGVLIPGDSGALCIGDGDFAQAILDTIEPLEDKA